MTLNDFEKTVHSTTRCYISDYIVDEHNAFGQPIRNILPQLVEFVKENKTRNIYCDLTLNETSLVCYKLNNKGKRTNQKIALSDKGGRSFLATFETLNEAELHFATQCELVKKHMLVAIQLYEKKLSILNNTLKENNFKVIKNIKQNP